VRRETGGAPTPLGREMGDVAARVFNLAVGCPWPQPAHLPYARASCSSMGERVRCSETGGFDSWGLSEELL